MTCQRIVEKDDGDDKLWQAVARHEDDVVVPVALEGFEDAVGVGVYVINDGIEGKCQNGKEFQGWSSLSFGLAYEGIAKRT